MDLPQLTIPEILYDMIMAGLSTAAFYVVITMVHNFWRERTARHHRRP